MCRKAGFQSAIESNSIGKTRLTGQVRLAMQNQSAETPSGTGSVLSGTEGPVQGGGYNAPAESSKNFIFRHKRLVGFIVLLFLLLTTAIVIASSVFFKKPQGGQQESVEAPPFDVNTINKDSELPETGGE